MSATSNPWKTLSLPPELTRIRSMLSHEEKQYLIWLTAEKFEGWGAIVDLGPWLGSSSAALAEGLKRQGKQNKIFSLDLFRWEPSYMEAIAHENLKEGDDFLSLFVREIGDYAGWVEPQKKDLMSYAWNGGPIEILFVDAAKTWELTNAIFKGFGSHLVPGRSRVVLQDFRHHTTHWLPLIFDSRPDMWMEIEAVEDGWTVTFTPLKPLFGPAGIQTDYSEKAFPLESVHQIFRNRISRESPRNQGMILRTLYRICLADGPPDEARQVRQELLAGGATAAELSEIEDIAFILVPRGWKAYECEDYITARTLAERCLTGKDQRPVYAVALLGMSLLRLGDLEGARVCIEEVVARLPDFLTARLYRAELAIAEGGYRRAETEALGVLKSRDRDEGTIGHSLAILEQVWDLEAPGELHLKALTDLLTSVGESPTFLARLAQKQFKLGLRDEAMHNVQKALKLAPGHELASNLRDEWISSPTSHQSRFSK
jgi:tetratricopeptide (TPR) repeat protein